MTKPPLGGFFIFCVIFPSFYDCDIIIVEEFHMYILDKLRLLTQTQSNTDMQIAQYLLMNIHRLKHLTVNQCIEECHISRASLHRFYHKAGFKDYKDLIQELNNEYDRKTQLVPLENFTELSYIHTKQITKLIQDIKKAHKIVFYGNYMNITMLEKTKLILQQEYHIEVIILLFWDKQYQQDILNQLTEDDLLIIVDANYSLMILLEKSMNQSDMLDLMQIDQQLYKKYYIGIYSDINTSYNTIEIQDTHNAYINNIQILSLDNKLSHLLKG